MRRIASLVNPRRGGLTGGADVAGDRQDLKRIDRCLARLSAGATGGR
jgi:hypothetical protein